MNYSNKQITQALEKIAYNIHTYTSPPGKVREANKKLRDKSLKFEEYNKLTGEKSLKTNPKLNLKIGLKSDEIGESTWNFTEPDVLDKKKAQKALERYKKSAKKYQETELTGEPTKYKEVKPGKIKPMHMAAGGLAGATGGGVLGKLISKKLPKSKLTLPLAGVGALLGLRGGTVRGKPRVTVKTRSPDIEAEKMRKKEIKDTIQQWEKAINDPKVKSMSLIEDT